MKARHLLLTVAATLVIFVAGVGTGHRLARTNLLPPAPRPQPQPVAANQPTMGRLDQFARQVRELDLDPMQRQRINRLFMERQEYMADLIRLVDPELHEMMPRLRREVHALLRPEQRDELERRFTERIRRENSGLLPEPRRYQPNFGDDPSGPRPQGMRPDGPRPDGQRFQPRPGGVSPGAGPGMGPIPGPGNAPGSGPNRLPPPDGGDGPQ